MIKRNGSKAMAICWNNRRRNDGHVASEMMMTILIMACQRNGASNQCVSEKRHVIKAEVYWQSENNSSNDINEVIWMRLATW